MDFRPNLRFPIKWQDEEIWPEKQWQWSRDRVQQALADNELVFNKQDDGGWSVRYKQYLRDENGIERGSKLYSVLTGPYTQEGTAEVDQLLGDGKIFPFPKPSSLIQHFVSHTKEDEDAIILDFFAGSCPAAQAVLEFNREHGGNRRFIMVQLPEPTLKETEAHEAGYRTIDDIGKERIRRVIAQMQREQEGQLPLDTRETPEDLGFKVFKLAASNYQLWRGVDEDTPDAYAEQMELFTDPLVDGWTAENVVYEVALKEGYGLNCRIEPVSSVTGNTIYRVTDPDKEQSFTICLDNAISLDNLSALNLGKGDPFICRDVALDDEAAANLALQCRLKTI